MLESSENTNPKTVENYSGTPRWVGLAVAVLAVLSVAALGLGWSASTRAKIAEQSWAPAAQSLEQNIAVLTRRLAQSEHAYSEVKGELGVVTDRLKLTQGELSRARKQAAELREEHAKKLAQVEQTVQAELAEKADVEAVEALSGDITGVRGDIEAARLSLQMARGELGTLIARNTEEIEQLRRLGFRDYYEFTLDAKGDRQQLGNVTIELRGTNTRRHLFTLALYADDMRLEKKNRSVNEPIYFYVQGHRAPLELVVNRVDKQKVTGYLSIPKASTVASRF